MEIRWSPEAVEDLERVVRHIQRDNFTAARKVADTIYTGVTNLENFPNRGRTGKIDGTRTPLSALAIHCRLSRETRRRRDRADWP